MTKGDTIRAKALEILGGEPKGIRWSELLKKVKAELPDMAPNTIHGSLWNLDSLRPSDVYKADRGSFRHLKYKETEAEKDIAEAKVLATAVSAQVNEEAFYAPFAAWIRDELEECTWR